MHTEGSWGQQSVVGSGGSWLHQGGEDLRVIKFLIKALSQHSYFYFYLANLHFVETWRLKFQSFFLGSRYTNHPAPCPLLHVFLFISVCEREREREITYRKVYIYNSFFILTWEHIFIVFRERGRERGRGQEETERERERERAKERVRDIDSLPSWIHPDQGSNP